VRFVAFLGDGQPGSSEPLDQLLVTLFLRKIVDALGDNLSDPGDFLDLLDGCRDEGVHRAESTRKQLGGSPANVLDAESVDQAPQWLLLALLDRRLEILGALLPEPFKPGDLLHVQMVDIADVIDPAKIDEPVCQLFSQPLYVHCRAPDEMVDT